MTVYTPISAVPTPDLTDAPNGPLNMLTIATTIDPQLVPTFTSSGARDAAISAPVAGSRCYRSDINALQVYNSAVTQWQSVGNVLISKTTLGSNTATVTFSSIPQDFTHLRLVAMVRSTKAALLDTMNLQFNGDSGVHYEYANMTVSNGGTSSFTTSSSGAATLACSAAICAASAAASVFSRFQMEIPFYVDNTTVTKNITAVNNAATNPLSVSGGNWIPTSAAAITQISLTVGSGSYATGSSFALYGLS